MGIARTAAKGLVPVAQRAAPHLTSGFVREILARAIDGVGPVRGAARAADAKLVLHGGDVEKAVKAFTSSHVRMAGAQGFATNIGGLVTLAVSIPANITGLALLQCHLVAGIAYLRGYDLGDPRVRNAVLVCLLGEDSVSELVKTKKLPARPMALATSPVHDPGLDTMVATMVTSELVAKVGGRRMALMIGRRVPLLGGGVGAVTDAMSTRQIGTYAADELLARHGNPAGKPAPA
ncbi:MAG: EcsC family protein [Actinomycetota bacterium]|nr:EcsC family protein [Actinomycetota bacterium]